MRKYIISGGPSTGKSTTFNLLHEIYPSAHFIPEPAEGVISRELARQAEDSSYVPTLPTVDYRKFAPLVVAESVRMEALIPKDADLVIQDRSQIDNLGYGTHYDFTDLFKEVQGHIRAARYTLAFFCDWLGKFEQTAIRLEDYDEGFDIHKKLETAYHNSGVPIVHLPPVSVEDRLAIVRDVIDTGV